MIDVFARDSVGRANRFYTNFHKLVNPDTHDTEGEYMDELKFELIRHAGGSCRLAAHMVIVLHEVVMLKPTTRKLNVVNELAKHVSFVWENTAEAEIIVGTHALAPEPSCCVVM